MALRPVSARACALEALVARGRSAFAPATPTEKAIQRRETRRPLQEHALVEGNLMEYPLFALSNKEAKPTKADPTGAIDPTTNKVKKVPDKARFKRVLSLETSTRSGVVIRRVTIEAHEDWGFPTVLGLELLIYACHKVQQNGFTSRYAPFTYYDFAKATHRSTSGASIANIRAQVHALLKTTIDFTDAWCRHPTEEQTQAAIRARGSGQAIDLPTPQFIGEQPEVHIIDKARLRTTKTNTPDEVLELLRYKDAPDDPEQKPPSYLRLSEEVFASLKAGYRFGVDPEYLFGLRLPVSKRMYVLLTKRDDRKHEWEQDLFRFCERLGLKRTRGKGDAWDQLKDGVLELMTPTSDGKVFLEGAEPIDVPGGRPKIYFRFANAEPARADTVHDEMHKFLRARVRAETYEQFMEPIRFSLDDRGGVETVLVLECKDRFHKDFVFDNYNRFFEENVVPEVLGNKTRLAYVVRAQVATDDGSEAA